MKNHIYEYTGHIHLVLPVRLTSMWRQQVQLTRLSWLQYI